MPSNMVLDDRYQGKISLLGGQDPYNLSSNEFKAEVKLPAIEFGDIFNFLVIQTSFCTGQQMKAYKALDSYNYFSSGFVTEVKLKKYGNRILLLARVNHSQRLRDTALKPWIIAQEDGTILAAHCNCMAGLSETCSHIGAVLFYVETGHRLNSVTPTGEKCKWVMPTAVKQVPYSEVSGIDLRSANKKKKDGDAGETPRSRGPTPVDPKYIPSQEQKDDFMSKVHECYSQKPPASILLISANHYKEFKPKNTSVPPYLPEALKDKECNNPFEKAEDIFKELTLTEDMVKSVERRTRCQSGSADWFRFRAGRITASNMKAACHTDPHKPSVSLVKAICYPSRKKISANAILWGVSHEKEARDLYAERMSGEGHDGHHVSDSGLFLNVDYPHLGASPDGMVECKCCGVGVVEVKCPYSLRNTDLAELTNEDLPPNSFFKFDENGEPELVQQHAYYYQVQAQIHICGVQYCDFVVWSQVTTIMIRVQRDTEFWENQMLPKLKLLYVGAILPELIAQSITSPANQMTEPALGPQLTNTNPATQLTNTNPATQLTNTNPATQLTNTNPATQQQCVNHVSRQQSTNYCTCGHDESYGDMIGCDGDNCLIEWYHQKCLGIKKAPRGRWLCPNCKNSTTSKKKARN